MWFLQELPRLIRDKIIRKKKVKINNPTSIIFKSLCEEIITISVSKVATRKFNNRGPKIKVMESLVE